MLLSLMMQLNMFGGNVPPIPPAPQTGDTGGGVRHQYIPENPDAIARKKVLKDNEELLFILKVFLQSQN